MPYVTKETSKEVRQKLKKEFPKYKFSVTIEDNSSLCVAIMKSDLSFDNDYKQINHYWLDKNWGDNPKALNTFRKILEVIESVKPQKEVTYDGDYGSIPNFYIDIQYGKWNKPHERLGA